MIVRLLNLVTWLWNCVLATRGNVRIVQLYPAVDFHVRVIGKGRKRALVSHRVAPLMWSDKDPRFQGHSIDWEARQIVRTIIDRGYQVDAVNAWSPLIASINPGDGFDLIFDENANVPLFYSSLANDCKIILYLTGSYPRFQNAQEMKRTAALRMRTGSQYFPKRQVKADMFDLSLEMAHHCVLVGNDVTVQTYPAQYRDKLVPITVSASDTLKKAADCLVPQEREFLWFFGEGAVHKGLDLLLSVFARRPDLHLNVVGNVSRERDFFNIFQRELTQCSNIRYHGFLRPTSAEFARIVGRCFCFIAPTCSEGISPAVVTCLTAGLFPLISRNAGVTLQPGAGLYLEECTLEEIEMKLDQLMQKPAAELAEQIALLQKMAEEKFSRERYAHDIRAFFANI